MTKSWSLLTSCSLFDLFNDYEKLKTYKYDEPTGGSVDMHEFHLELPYNNIK